MFLHIGLNTVLDVKDIVAIISLEDDSGSVVYPKAEIISISDQKNKSMIIFNDKKRSAVYLSHISSITLKKRIDQQYI